MLALAACASLVIGKGICRPLGGGGGGGIGTAIGSLVAGTERIVAKPDGSMIAPLSAVADAKAD